jgi:hypothetical protein
MSRYLYVIVFMFLACWLKAQTETDSYLSAEDFLNDGNYYKALSLYQEELKNSPNNANLNFKIGYCYLNTSVDKTKAIPYLEFASKHIKNKYDPKDTKEEGAPIEALFYLGQAYHVNYRFDDAERTFMELKNQLAPSEKELTDNINHELLACQVARQLLRSPVEMTVSNMGPNVNSIYSEHSPVISGDESILIFTSKREGNVGNTMTDDGQYFEDIYLSNFSGKSFGKAQNISPNINTPGHEASVSLSFDGLVLFIYRDDNGDGNLYRSTRTGNEWSVPEKLPEPINSKYRETHASMSMDQSEIFFTSERKGGYGGLDIYRVKKLPNGKWSKAMNLGPQINTPYDEEGPYLHPDGTSLFFASKGHNTMGGYDVFVAQLDENEKWLVPENLGYPINTPDDDVYYIPSVDGRRAYYASYSNNSLGNYDLFRIDLSETHVRNQTVIRGKAVSPDGTLLQKPIITVNDDDDNVTGIYTPDPNTNSFLMILPRGKNFKVTFESANFPKFDYFIKVPEYSYNESQSVVALNDIVSKETKQLLASAKQEQQERQNKNVQSSAQYPDEKSKNQDEKADTIKVQNEVKENTSDIGKIEHEIVEQKIPELEGENDSLIQKKSENQEERVTSKVNDKNNISVFRDFKPIGIISISIIGIVLLVTLILVFRRRKN